MFLIVANTTISNDPSSLDKLPEIVEGQNCTPGKAYKMDCNVCKCGSNNSLICTKKACFNQEEMDHFMAYRKSKQRKGKTKSQNGKCTPGKYYKRDCNKCFCNDKGKLICTAVGCVGTEKLNRIKDRMEPLTFEDVRPPLTEKEKENALELPTISSRCEPGKNYKVDCNWCWCDDKRNLICTLIYCISFEDMNRIKAKNLSGKRCKTDDDKTLKKEECVKCSCVKRRSKCEPIPDCSPESIVEIAEARRLHGKVEEEPETGNKIETLNLKPKDDCIAGAVYKDKCNKCYCQEDQSLRCTQKACLNYVESLKLKKHRLFLEKHGL